MPVPSNIIPLSEFARRMANRRAQEANIKSQQNHCYWCDEFTVVLIAKGWHGFCSDKCWKEYRDSRLAK